MYSRDGHDMAKNVQFDDFRGMLERLKKYEQKEQEFFEACAKELAARLLAKLIKRTPVGLTTKKHKGGTLRRGWTAKTEAQAAAGGSSQGTTKYVTGLRVQKIGNAYQITIINPVHYASYINYGHRQKPGRYVPALGKKLVKAWVPGNHMVEISEAEIEAEQHAIIERKLKKFLKEMFSDAQ